MILPKETLTKWSALKERGDIPALVHITGLSRSTVYSILETGVCTISVAGKIKKYFDQRKKAVKQLTQEQD